MSSILFANNAKTTLASPIDSAATSVTVASGDGALFPNPTGGNLFIATFVDAATGLVNEIVHVTARSGDVMTIVRAQEGTTARDWLAGDTFANFWTAGSAEAMLQQGQNVGVPYAVDSGSVNAMEITLSPAPGAMSALVGVPIAVMVANTNTSATPTLNINSLGAFNCKNVNSSGVAVLGIGTAAANKIALFAWDGTQFQYLGLPNPATTAQIQTGTEAVSYLTSANLRAAMPFYSGSTEGYQTFTSGWTVQWGTYTSSTGNNDSITMPFTFPNNAISIVATSNENGNTGVVMSCNFSSTSIFLASAVNLSGTHQVGATIHWAAFGN